MSPPAYRRFHVIIWFLAGGAASTLVVHLVPATVPPSTAADFFLAASGVNATILVAVTISSLVRQRTIVALPWRNALFVAQLSVVFVGMMAGGLVILHFSPDVPFDSVAFRGMAGLVLVTWILGFMLLVVGVEASASPSTGEA